jgi:hypothetical protein
MLFRRGRIKQEKNTSSQKNVTTHYSLVSYLRQLHGKLPEPLFLARRLLRFTSEEDAPFIRSPALPKWNL